MDSRPGDVELIFAGALEVPAGPERERYVSGQCGRDQHLLSEVVSLLRAHEEAGEFLVPCRHANGPFSDLPESPGNETLPHFRGYRIEGKLGAGSIGTVYAAFDEKLQRRVAIKILRPLGGDERRRVLEEARKSASISDPAIVTIFSVVDEVEPAGIVMELVEGFPIDRFAAELTFPQKAKLLREVARGLAAAHTQGLIHRDLKPQNILVSPDMRPRILDFGLSLSVGEASSSAGFFEGTPLYASPEQARRDPLSTAADIFSFGSVMFKVLTGRVPFMGKSLQEVLKAIVENRPPFLREIALGIPEDLQAICLACLALAPQDRPTADEIALELGRYILGEPVRLRPKLYDDVLRQDIAHHAAQAASWESQSIISRDERDALEAVHRRLLADEDHWIIDARRITVLQTVLSTSTWLAVVSTVLAVWMLRQELTPLWQWLLPTCFTGGLAVAGYFAKRDGDILAGATFLAGATLALAPCLLSWLGALQILAFATPGVSQLFPDFSNQQVLASSMLALAGSTACLWRFKMTAFAWTTCILLTATYLSWLLMFNWLERAPEVQALWCLPLVALEGPALLLEKRGRVRWTMPFHLVAGGALIGCLDVLAFYGPTLHMLGMEGSHVPYFNENRQLAFSFALNGLLFIALMLLAERSRSLDLRRAAKLLEALGIVHVLSALFLNAIEHRADPGVKSDVWLYLAAAGGFMILAAWRSRWRMLVGGLAGVGLGSYLLVEIGLVARKPFIIGIGCTGILIAVATYLYVRARANARTIPRP